MRKIYKTHVLVGLALMSLLMAGGCTARQGQGISVDADSDAAYASYSGKGKSGTAGTSRKKSTELDAVQEWEARALGLVLDTADVAKGTPYVFGGTSLSGFDCSGLVRWAYKSVGVDLPRSAREQAQYGERVAKDELREGDIVAFRHPKRGYHTGLYVGEGQFIHSPRRRDVVKISSLTDPYFNSTYLGARRPSLPDSVNLVEVEKHLAAMKAQKKALQTANLSRKRTSDAAVKAQSGSSKSKQKAKASSKSSKKSSKKSEKTQTSKSKQKSQAAVQKKPTSSQKSQAQVSKNKSRTSAKSKKTSATSGNKKR